MSCLLCEHLPFSARAASLAFLLIGDLVELQFVPCRWRCHQWKRVLQASLHGAKSKAAGMTWEREYWNGKTKTNKQNPKSLHSWHLKSELSLEKGS